MKNYLPFLKKIADSTDQIALNYFNKVNLAVSYKTDNSPVSEADKLIEISIRKIAKKNNLPVFGEEFGEDKAGSIRLIVDPIDGTRNFIRGIPIFATLLAIEKEGHIIAGLVSAPALKTRWYAEKETGAFSETTKKNKLKVSIVNQLAKAQIFHGSIYGNEIKQKHYSDKLLSLLRKTERQRGIGDFYQHMLVAQGSGEAALDPVVSPWDIGAIKIIVEEAGGMFTAFSGKDSIYEGTALSTNGLMHAEIQELLK